MYSVTWYDVDHTIILVSYSGQFSWKEFDQAGDETVLMLDNSPRVVDLLVEFKTAMLPLDYTQRFAEVSESSPFLYHPNAGHTVICSSNRFIGAMVGVFDRLFNPRRGYMHYATSVEAGVTQLDRYKVKA